MFGSTRRTRIKRLARISALATIVAGSLAAPASAYTLNADGTGWVGKGEVQTVFGLNNKQMQAVHTGVTFSHESSAQYAQSCMKIIENKKETKINYHDFKKTVEVNAVIASDSRKTGQWTGWFLTGYDTSVDNGVPTDLCNPGNDENNADWEPDPEGLYQRVTLVEGSQSGGLYAYLNGASALLTPTL